MIKLNDSNLEKIEILVDFLIKFNLLSIPLYVIILSGMEFTQIQLIVSNIVYQIFNIIGYSVRREGINLIFDQAPLVLSITINTDCTGWKSMYTLFALMLASPVPHKFRKIRNILIAISLVFLANILRISSILLLTAKFGTQYINWLHSVIWQPLMIITILFVWLIWLKRQRILFKKEQTILRSVQDKLKNKGWI